MNSQDNLYPEQNTLLVKHWLLNLLVPLSHLMDNHSRFALNNEEVIHYLLNTEEFSTRDDEDVKNKLRIAYDEAKSWDLEQKTSIDNSIEKIRVMLNLTDTESKVFRFAAYVNLNQHLNSVCQGISNCGIRQMSRGLSTILNCPEREIRAIFKSGGGLVRSGIFDNHRHHHCPSLADKLTISGDGLLDAIADDDINFNNLLKESVEESSNRKLTKKNYEHISETVNILVLYLKQSIKDSNKGVNILIHGVPGTGKTQLARLIADELSTQLFEIRTSEPNGDMLTGNERMLRYLRAQAILKPSSGIVLFDEFEDSFASGGFFRGRLAEISNKGWLNHILESNPLPCIWVCNDLDQMHDAYLRRFDLIFEITQPNQNIKTDLINSMSHTKIDKKVLKELAGMQSLSPAIIERSCNVVNKIAEHITDPSDTLRVIINNALGVQKKKIQSTTTDTQYFNAHYIRANFDLEKISRTLDSESQARICLYGPPGTGKTAYAHWLAEKLDMSVISKKGSDLLGSFVGETERNIAEAFINAKENKSLLLIDEVDSFIFDRSRASKSWENSCVNEMLTQMESFNGIFIATTNLADTLDQASLRRFDLKVKFDFLDTKQVKSMLTDHCAQLDIDGSVISEEALNKLQYLTPGDFSAVKRRSRFSSIASLDELIVALQEEMSFKEQSKVRRIGF